MAKRQVGSFKSGSFGSWLQTAKPGDHFWIEGQNANSVSGTAFKYGVKIGTRTYYAVHPGTMEVVALVRAEVKGDFIDMTDPRIKQEGK